MKALRYLPLLVLLAVVGCAQQPLLTDGTSVADRARETLARVEAGRVLAYKHIYAEASTGVFSQGELRGALENLDEAGKYIDRAHTYRRAGAFDKALSEAVKSEALLTSVQSLLAERIKKQRN